MNLKTIRRRSVLVMTCLVLSTSMHAGADSSTIWEAISEYRSVKSTAELKSVKQGEVVVNVCNDCQRVVLVLLVSASQGQANFNLEKCRSCGSTNTFTAVPEKSGPK